MLYVNQWEHKVVFGEPLLRGQQLNMVEKVRKEKKKALQETESHETVTGCLAEADLWPGYIYTHTSWNIQHFQVFQGDGAAWILITHE